jgi:hypothetical protein
MSAGPSREAIEEAARQMREWIAKEGDAREFEESGYHCVIIREPVAGYLSGYVGLPRAHSLYGLDLSGLEDRTLELVVHGGVGFAGPQVANGRERPGLWYFGFDCNHLDDLCLKDFEGADAVSLSVKHSSTYKTMEFVEAELRSLAQQLKAAEHQRIYR